jgi:hypothetical protein
VKPSQPLDPRILEALEGATHLQLYQLGAVIDHMLADPRRSLAARAALNLGQAVCFVDHRDGQMRLGKIIAFKDTRATVLEEGVRRTWKIPCVAMEGFFAADREDARTGYEPPPEPAAPPSPARGFQQGDTVTFQDRDGRTVTGLVVRLNRQTASIATGDGGKWRVPFGMLRHVINI